MIELLPAENDDASFLSLAQRIVNGAIAALQAHDVYLVQIDSWFDHKWLGWWSRWKHGELSEMCVPPFNPNRVRSQKHYLWASNGFQWTLTGEGKPLHLAQPGRSSSRAQRLDWLSKSAIFIWYSGNTVTNGAGSLMVYLSGAEGYAWYASFKKGAQWTVADGCRVTRRELALFEEGGRQMELVPA